MCIWISCGSWWSTASIKKLRAISSSGVSRNPSGPFGEATEKNKLQFLNTLPKVLFFLASFLPYPTFLNVAKDMLFTYLVGENGESHSWTEPGKSTGHSLILAPSLSQTRLSLTHWNGSALGKGERFYFKWPLEYLASTPNTTLLQSTAWADPFLSFSEDSEVELHRTVAERIVTHISIPEPLCGVDQPAVSPPACLAASWISMSSARIVNNGFIGVPIGKDLLWPWKNKNKGIRMQ